MCSLQFLGLLVNDKLNFPLKLRRTFTESCQWAYPHISPSHHAHHTELARRNAHLITHFSRRKPTESRLSSCLVCHPKVWDTSSTIWSWEPWLIGVAESWLWPYWWDPMLAENAITCFSVLLGLLEVVSTRTWLVFEPKACWVSTFQCTLPL